NERMQGLGNNLDLDAAWADLEAKRSQKSKGRSFFFWLILLGGFGTGLAAGKWQPSPYPETLLSSTPKQTALLPSQPSAEKATQCFDQAVDYKRLPSGNQSPTLEVIRPSSTVVENTKTDVHTTNRIVFKGQTSPLPPITLRMPLTGIPPFFNNDYSATASLGKVAILAPISSLAPDQVDQTRKGLVSAMAPPRKTNGPWSLKASGQYGILSQSGLAEATAVDIFGGTAQARYTVKPWLWLETGLAYQQLNSQITYDQELVEFQTLENQVIAYVEYADGTIEEFRGEATATVRTFESFTGWQKHRIFSVPIQVGIGLPLPSRSQVGIYLGGSYGFIANHGGYGVAPESAERTLLKELEIRRTNLFQWQASLFAEQSVGKRWSVQIVLGRQQAIGDWGLGLSPQAWSGQLGIVRKLAR
ncbi:MAG: hypothetical protein AAFU60_07615, partial [Bacteroidota bacterium]